MGHKAVAKYVLSEKVKNAMTDAAMLTQEFTARIYVELRSVNRGFCIVNDNVIKGVGLTEIEALNDYAKTSPMDAEVLFLNNAFPSCLKRISKQAIKQLKQGKAVDTKHQFDNVIISSDIKPKQLVKRINKRLKQIDIKKGAFKLRLRDYSFDLKKGYSASIFSLMVDNKKVTLPKAELGSSIPISAYHGLFGSSLKVLIDHLIVDWEKKSNYYSEMNLLFKKKRGTTDQNHLLYLGF